MKKVLCPGEALIDFVSMNAGKSLKATNGFIKKAVITYSYKVFRIIQELLENDYEHFVYQKSIELNGKSDTKRTG